MRFFLEIVLVTVAIVASGGALLASFRRMRADDVHPMPSYLLALGAWVPVWFFTHVLWYPVTGHHSALSYPWWFWVILGVAGLVTLSALVSRAPYFRQLLVVQILGSALVVIALCYVNWFGPNAHNSGWWVAFAVFLAVLVVAVVALLLAKVFEALAVVAVVAVPLALIGLLGAIVAGMNLATSGGGSNHPSAKGPTPTVTNTVTKSSTVTKTVTLPINSQKAATQFCKIFVACKKPGAINVGTTVNWGSHHPTHGVNDFTTGNQVLKSQSDVARFLNGSSARSKAAKAQVVAAIKKAGFGQSEINRALNGTGYFSVQPTQASQMLGTTYFSNGKVLTVNGWRAIAPGDVFWVFMTQDGTIVKDAIIRADCGNQKLIKVVPTTPSSPPVPPVTCTTNNCVPVPPCTLAAQQGYVVVGCQLVKKPCVDRNGQACGPNVPYQPPQSPGNGVQSTANNPMPGVSGEPDPLPSGPGGPAYPPTQPASSGYNPGSGAPGGGSNHSGSTSVNPPKPDPTPSCSVSCGSGTQTTSPPQPG